MNRKLAVILVLLLLAFGILPAAAQNDPEANKEVVRSALAALSSGNPDAFYDLFTDPFKMNQGGTTLEDTTRSDNEFFNAALLGAMPDLQVVPTLLIARDDLVAAQVTYSGTFSEPFSFPPYSEESFPPTNAEVIWTTIDILRFNDEGLVTEVYDMSDPFALFSQLGVFPAEERDGTGIALDAPAGYQALSNEALAATFTSGMETRNLDLLNQQAVSGFGDFPQFFANPYISWSGGEPFSVTAEGSAEDPSFSEIITEVMPDVRIQLIKTVAEGDWTAGAAKITGTFTEDGELFGMSLTATGEEISFLLGVIYRYDADGKIIEEWVDGDFSPLFIGLGIMGEE